MSGEFTVFAALATVQVMQATGCGRQQAAVAVAQAGDNYHTDAMTSEALTSMLLDAINNVRAHKALLGKDMT